MTDTAELPVSQSNSVTTRIRPLRLCDKGPTLFCLHGRDFGALVSALSSVEASFYGLDVYGLQTAPVDFSVEQLAREHLRDMRTVQPNGPYILVGHSFGGLIAWEMAVQLIESGATVAFLALLDTPHPHFLGTLSPEEREVALRVYRTDRMQKYLYNLKRGRLDLLMTGAVGYVSNKTRLRAWAAWQRARRAFGRSAPAKGSLILRIDDIWHKYAPPTLDIRLLQVRAQGRDAEFAGDATMGWRKLALKGVDVQFSPGLHQYMTKDPHAIHLAQLLIPYILALRGSAESQRVC